MWTNPEFLAKIPSAAAMPILVGLLVLMRRRHPELSTRGWLAALGFIFVAQLQPVLVMIPARPSLHLTVHALLLNGELLAGLTLATYKHRNGKPGRPCRWFVILNTVPLIVFTTLYGYYVFVPRLYFIAAAAGIAAFLWTAYQGKISLTRAGLESAAFVVSAAFIYWGQYRMGEYWLLLCVFVVAILNLHATLPPRTVGKLAILTSMSVWALFYLVHPWAVKSAPWFQFTNELWDLQKFLLCIGMLLVLLEDQVESTHWLALHDQLTNLPNRRMLDDHLDNLIAEAGRNGGKLLLLMVDLNGFKAVNDTYGHATGDMALCEVARRMQCTLHTREMLVRLGGDEFVIVSPHLNNDWDIEQMETRLQKALQEPILIAGQELTVSGTFGSATYPDDTIHCDPRRIAATLLHVSDERMYSRKMAR